MALKCNYITINAITRGSLANVAHFMSMMVPTSVTILLHDEVSSAEV